MGAIEPEIDLDLAIKFVEQYGSDEYDGHSPTAYAVAQAMKKVLPPSEPVGAGIVVIDADCDRWTRRYDGTWESDDAGTTADWDQVLNYGPVKIYREVV